MGVLTGTHDTSIQHVFVWFCLFGGGGGGGGGGGELLFFCCCCCFFVGGCLFCLFVCLPRVRMTHQLHATGFCTSMTNG